MLVITASAKRFRMWVSGAPSAHCSCLAIGLEIVASSSPRSEAWKSG